MKAIDETKIPRTAHHCMIMVTLPDTIPLKGNRPPYPRYYCVFRFQEHIKHVLEVYVADTFESNHRCVGTITDMSSNVKSKEQQLDILFSGKAANNTWQLIDELIVRDLKK